MRRSVVGLTSSLVFLGSLALTSTPAAAQGETQQPGHGIQATAGPTERSLLVRGHRSGAGALYAVNNLTNHVVRFDRVHGRWQTSLIGSGWTHPSQVRVASHGLSWVTDSGAGTLVRVSPSGGQRVVRRLSDPGAVLNIDGHGNAYVLDGTTIIEVKRSGRTQIIIGSVPSPVGFGVDRAGRVRVAAVGPTADDGTTDLDVYDFPVGGGTPTRRRLADGTYYGAAGAVVGSSTGSLVLLDGATSGASAFQNLVRVDPGSSTEASPGSKIAYYAYAFDTRGLLYVMENRFYCLPPDLFEGCVPDSAVDRILVYPAAGGDDYSTIPVRNVTLPSGGLAASVRGQVFTSESDGSGKAPLKVIPAGGGTAQVVIRGDFVSLTVPPGR